MKTRIQSGTHPIGKRNLTFNKPDPYFINGNCLNFCVNYRHFLLSRDVYFFKNLAYTNKNNFLSKKDKNSVLLASRVQVFLSHVQALRT